ncbi:MAG TPA: hypothetical protein VFO44_18710, partial [Steroidobacteraceae bacterium]|nr:hypothetical protein [Steroidobacteraceae bacterium]
MRPVFAPLLRLRGMRVLRMRRAFRPGRLPLCGRVPNGCVLNRCTLRGWAGGRLTGNGCALN